MGAPPPDMISPISEGVALLEAERIVRETFRQSHCGGDFEPGEMARLLVVAISLIDKRRGTGL